MDLKSEQQPTPPAQSSDNLLTSITSSAGLISEKDNVAMDAKSASGLGMGSGEAGVVLAENSDVNSRCPPDANENSAMSAAGSASAAADSNSAPPVDPSVSLGVQLQYQQQQLQRHQEALVAQQRYLEQQQSYIQQLCALQERIRHETPETAARLLAMREAPVGRPNQWNYAQAPIIPAVSIAAPKSRLLPKEQVERLTQCTVDLLFHHVCRSHIFC